ncbi:heme peroxidase [Lentinula lateritia]|nr:heme peroxidase [Lentinula lateritia]
MLQYPSISYAIITFGLAGWVHSLSTFQWPNPQLAYTDKLIYESGLNLLAQGCPSRDNTTVPAQWLRIAYHDMSTHDVDDGTGGLDASIQFELDRPQNIGLGMFDSLNDFRNFLFAAPFFGMADTIALGAVLAVAGCGGLLIPFSAGRVDATEAGPATVPEPQQDLASHTEAFRRQGFTPTEMIGLVACGHTLGGVRQVDFPLIVTDTEVDVQTFDTTTNFDNVVVSEYLQNTTENILVVGPNVTTRSDFRIFSSDGNVTMQRHAHLLVLSFALLTPLASFLSSDTFNETCGNLIERMINTVPSGVTLAQAISEPFNYIINISDNPSRTVNLLRADRQGSSCPSSGCTSPSTGSLQTSLGIFGGIQGLTADRYTFNATINATTSISKFWFEINENDGSDPIVVDNGGSGFVIGQDSVFIDNSRSKFVFLTVSEISYQRLVVAVRGDASSSVSITTFDPHSDASTPPYLPTIMTTNLQLDDSNPVEGGYTFFTANVTGTVTFLNISGNVGDVSYAQENFDMTVVDFPFAQISQ